MADIFLAYEPDDRGLAELIGNQLRVLGYDVFWERSRLLSRTFLEDIQRELDAAKCVVAIWTDESRKSRLLRNQARRARARGVLVCVTWHSSKLPWEFRTLESFDMTKWTPSFEDRHFRAFERAIHKYATPALLTNAIDSDFRNQAQAETADAGPTQAKSRSPSDQSQSINDDAPITIAENHARRSMVFVCYRRQDTQDAAGRLYDRLLDVYGSDRVFMDIDSVPLGIDFVDHVTTQISRCSVVIVMIGRQWLSIRDRQGRTRLEAEDDLVRVEVAAALRQKIPVIPVLVQDAEMPQAEDLPDSVHPSLAGTESPSAPPAGARMSSA